MLMSAPLSVTPVTSSEMLSGPGNVVEKSMVECWSDTPKRDRECWSDTLEDEEGRTEEEDEEEVVLRIGDEEDEINCWSVLAENIYSLLKACSWDCSSAEFAIS